MCRGDRLYDWSMKMRDLPSVDALAANLKADTDLPEALVLAVVRRSIDTARAAIRASEEPGDLVERTRQTLSDLSAARPTTVINATGVLLHTNLGRAPIAGSTASASAEVASSASNVELDIRTGKRSKRHDYLKELLPVVTAAEAGFAVNNNAGALLLALASVAGHGGRIAVSRGELIEIGGSFRLPSLMKASGAELVEVGTTNRTRLSDYGAVADQVDGILKVHPSNYRIDGFHEDTSYEDLAQLATNHNIPFIADVGSGLIDDTAPWLGDADRSWLRSEPGVKQTVAAGASLVLFSGDKLLGGPQAGIIVGRHADIARAMKHPIARAVRLDGQTIAGLASTLEMYADSRVLEIPFWRMASATVDQLRERSQSVIGQARQEVSLVDSDSVPGAGSVPGESIPSVAIRIEGSPDTLWQSLANAPTPVIATRREGALYIDLRSVDPQDDAAVAAAISAAVT